MKVADLKKHAGQVLVIAIAVMVGLFIHSYAQTRLAERKMMKAVTTPEPAIEE